MEAMRSLGMLGVATALVLAASLPAAAQVATNRPLTVARPTTTMVLSTPGRTPQQLSPEQQQWIADQVRRHPDFDAASLDGAARERFAGQSEASYEYLLEQAARLAAGDNQEQLRRLQAQLAALEAQKRALRNQIAQKEGEVAGKEAEAESQKHAAQDAYLKTQSLRMPTISMDTSSGSAKLSSAGSLAEPEGPADAPGDASERLSPSLRAWVKSQARALVDRGVTPDPNLIAGDVRTRLAGQDFSDADIMAIAYLVMMEAAKAAQDDMREIMEQMKSQNERKAAMREAMQAQRAAAAQDQVATRPELKAVCVDPPCKPQLAADVSRAADQKDSMSEMGEMQSLRLQMAMDRRSKFFETLSNMLKKYADTASTITSNLK